VAKEEIEEVEETEVVEEGTAKGGPKGGPEGIVPADDLKPLMDEVDRILGAPMPEGEEVVGEEAMAEEVIEAPGEEIVAEETVTVDVTPLMEALNIDEAQARALHEAAQQIASLEGLEVEALAEALAADFQLRMQVEKIAGSIEDNMMADEAEIGVEADLAAGLNPGGMPAPMTPGGY